MSNVKIEDAMDHAMSLLAKPDKSAPFDLSPMQREAWNAEPRRYNVKSGATRSGKTYLDYFIIPRRLMETTDKGLNFILGTTQGSINRNIIEPMREMYGTDMVSKISSAGTVTIFGKRVHILGAGNKKRVDVLRGATVEYCYADEVATYDPDMFYMLQSRLSLPNSLVDATCNPEGPNHWFKKFLDSDQDIFQQHYTIYDNPFNSPKFVESVEKAYVGTVYFERNILGLWHMAEGIIYPKFANNPEKYFINSKDVPKFREINIGVDFGGNKSKHTFVATGITPDYQELYILASERVETGIDPVLLAEKYVDFLLMVESIYGQKVLYTYTDNAEQMVNISFKTALRKRGLNRLVRDCYKGGREGIIGRIKATAALIGQERLFYTEHAETAKNALSTCLWDAKSEKETKRLDDGTTDIDTLDAFEYSFSKSMGRMTRYVG